MVDELEDVAPFEEIPSSVQALEDAEDETLLALVFAYDGQFETTADITSNAMATFLLRDRGYTVTNDDEGSLLIRDTSGEQITAQDLVGQQ